MNNLRLQLVTFEQAKSLKELGFPQPIQHDWFYKESKLIYPPNEDVLMAVDYFAPTLELAAKWLREEKNILIEITRVFGKYAGRIMELHTSGERNLHIQFQEYFSYEEALSAGIDAALEYLMNNLIK